MRWTQSRESQIPLRLSDYRNEDYAQKFNRFGASFDFLLFLLLFFSIHASAQNFQPFAFAHTSEPGFANPILKTSGAADNLRGERFVSELALDERLQLCRSIEIIAGKLNRTNWSPALAAELKCVWQVFLPKPLACARCRT